MSFIFLIIGVAIGYFFKPQLDKLVTKIIREVKNIQNKSRDNDDYR